MPTVRRVGQHPATVTQRIITMAVVAAALVSLGSFSYCTRWESTTTSVRSGEEQSWGTATDGIGQWAILTFPLGLLALGLLVGARGLAGPEHRPGQWRPRIAAILALLAAIPLIAASAIADQYWQFLLVARAAGPRVDTSRGTIDTLELAYIAWGLPTVTVAGALGALICAVLAVVLVRNTAPA